MDAIKEWIVTYRVTGRAAGVVDAATAAEAMEKAKALDVHDDHLIEWEYEEPIRVEANE